jgi:hypothetical protein
VVQRADHFESGVSPGAHQVPLRHGRKTPTGTSIVARQRRSPSTSDLFTVPHTEGAGLLETGGFESAVKTDHRELAMLEIRYRSRLP